jgi:hypothetical protein
MSTVIGAAGIGNRRTNGWIVRSHSSVIPDA